MNKPREAHQIAQVDDSLFLSLLTRSLTITRRSWRDEILRRAASGRPQVAWYKTLGGARWQKRAWQDRAKKIGVEGLIFRVRSDVDGYTSAGLPRVRYGVLMGLESLLSSLPTQEAAEASDAE